MNTPFHFTSINASRTCVLFCASIVKYTTSIHLDGLRNEVSFSELSNVASTPPSTPDMSAYSQQSPLLLNEVSWIGRI